MKNVFLLYIPPTNHEAVVHYEDTIKSKIDPQRIYQYVNHDLRNKLERIFLGRRIAVWGSRDSEVNRSRFEKMKDGDDILIIEGDTIKLLGKIAAKTINQDLSRELWKNIKGATTEGWDLIYFIANPQEVNLPFSEFNNLFGYEADYTLRGFTNIAEDRLASFYEQYDDLYDVLIRIKNGDEVIRKDAGRISDRMVEYETVVPEENKEEIKEEVSEHLKIQWKLIQLGLKASTRVWIPRNDQSKITGQYHYDEFEKEFTAGLDTDARYVENIDVVWKDEFRIDAAFEVENSTSIYSGLLRFSDLKIVAPNSNYPLFIVAPLSRKAKVINQVKRPTFRKLDFHKKVRYLSYEAVEETERFFEDSTSGLNVELLTGRSEEIN